jgi:hypothetical protein
MFVQVITGKTSNAAQVRAALDRWVEELAPGAEGWLGSTAGVTEDGRLVALARFESEEAAQRNNDRPEQDQWWAETAQLLDGEATFRNSVNVMPDLHGDPDQAGFVQIMQGQQGPDPDRAQELMNQNPTSGPRSARRSSETSAWPTRTTPGPWPCTSRQRRRLGKVNARNRRPS